MNVKNHCFLVLCCFFVSFVALADWGTCAPELQKVVVSLDDSPTQFENLVSQAKAAHKHPLRGLLPHDELNDKANIPKLFGSYIPEIEEQIRQISPSINHEERVTYHFRILKKVFSYFLNNAYGILEERRNTRGESREKIFTALELATIKYELLNSFEELCGLLNANKRSNNRKLKKTLEKLRYFINRFIQGIEIEIEAQGAGLTLQKGVVYYSFLVAFFAPDSIQELFRDYLRKGELNLVSVEPLDWVFDTHRLKQYSDEEVEDIFQMLPKSFEQQKAEIRKLLPLIKLENEKSSPVSYGEELTYLEQNKAERLVERFFSVLFDTENIDFLIQFPESFILALINSPQLRPEVEGYLREDFPEKGTLLTMEDFAQTHPFINFFKTAPKMTIYEIYGLEEKTEDSKQAFIYALLMEDTYHYLALLEKLRTQEFQKEGELFPLLRKLRNCFERLSAAKHLYFEFMFEIPLKIIYERRESGIQIEQEVLFEPENVSMSQSGAALKKGIATVVIDLFSIYKDPENVLKAIRSVGLDPGGITLFLENHETWHQYMSQCELTFSQLIQKLNPDHLKN